MATSSRSATWSPQTANARRCSSSDRSFLYQASATELPQQIGTPRQCTNSRMSSGPMPGAPRQPSPGCSAGLLPAVPRLSCGSARTLTHPRWRWASPDSAGAHAAVADHGGRRALDTLIAEDPEHHLGSDSVAEFGPRLPFLLKVLAADSPLSLQVHPTLEQARDGFAREEAAGVDRARGGTQLQGRQPQAGDDLRADTVRGAVRLPAGGRSACRLRAAGGGF